jgi:hypothetical protein
MITLIAAAAERCGAYQLSMGLAEVDRVERAGDLMSADGNFSDVRQCPLFARHPGQSGHQSRLLNNRDLWIHAPTQTSARTGPTRLGFSGHHMGWR